VDFKLNSVLSRLVLTLVPINEMAEFDLSNSSLLFVKTCTIFSSFSSLTPARVIGLGRGDGGGGCNLVASHPATLLLLLWFCCDSKNQYNIATHSVTNQFLIIDRDPKSDMDEFGTESDLRSYRRRR